MSEQQKLNEITEKISELKSLLEFYEKSNSVNITSININYHKFLGETSIDLSIQEDKEPFPNTYTYTMYIPTIPTGNALFNSCIDVIKKNNIEQQKCLKENLSSLGVTI